MPHDRKGNKVEVGDIVTILGKVKDVQPQEEYCNVTVETVFPMLPGTDKSTLTLNANQVEKIG